MYQLIYTKGDSEKVIKELADLSEARQEAKRLQKLPEYSDGIVTVEKNGRIY